MENKPLDILAIGVHPDDVELSCSGTLLREIAAGKRCGVLHLTHGEMGTRGTAALRLKESDAASKLMGLHVHEQLDMKDCGIVNDAPSRTAIIRILRKYRPRIVLGNTLSDRHPDHGHAGNLISESCFYSGLEKLETSYEGKTQKAFRPQLVLHYAQDHLLMPDLITDISPYMKQKLEVIMCYASQFYSPGSSEPETSISRKDFLLQVEGRARTYGRQIGVEFGEAYTCIRPLGVTDISAVF
ncbi:MAG: bacillithiol biosynthesis deacetylase BshB1 [Bacteroidia bacterium]|nr:bacillithiol biosynthesis deacetylase BshB1 [Bacteroidia bacterium]